MNILADSADETIMDIVGARTEFSREHSTFYIEVDL